MDESEKAIFNQLKQIASEHNLHGNAIYNLRGGTGWINYKKVDDNDYMIQISTPRDYTEYKEIKDAVCAVFENVGSVMIEEEEYGNRPAGYQRELTFMDKRKFERQKQEEMSSPVTNNIGTQINGNVSTACGNINTGNATTIDSRISQNETDPKWFQKEVVKMILSFIGGVATTLVAEWLIHIIGWI